MGKKFCSKCGHGSEAMSSGVATKFCAKCGNDLESLATFGAKPPAKRSRLKRSRPSRREREEEECWDEEEDEFSNIDSIVASLEVDIDAGGGGPLKLGDIAKQDKTGFSRSPGGGYGKNAIKGFMEDNAPAQRGGN